ncbi:MAG: Gfo/Idh/MocA family oxidoreductase [candidate division NC10 bacterium]|jgi:predicted dehydrogenase|nr:Gfo/Idh/MocA family oxidoreductase [candidate division NC10 bacterium]
MGGERKTRVGVIGVGHVGQHHARIYRELPGVELAGIADIDPARLQEVKRVAEAPVFQDYRELFGHVEAVSLAVPTHLHAQIARECLDRGVDVLVEKPMAQTLEEAEELTDLAKRRGRILQVGHVERFNGAVRALHRIVKTPGFIECHRLSPFPQRGTDVDVILDLMIHDIDIILSLVKSPVSQVNAVGVPVLTDRVDISNARLEFASGCVANVTASRVSIERLRKIRIFQPDTYISLDYASQEITLFRRLPPDLASQPPQPPQIVREEVVVEKEEPLRLQLMSFLSSVRERTRPEVSGEEAVEALRVASQILAKI